MRTRVFYCNSCHKETVHNLVDKTSTLEKATKGLGFYRAAMAFSTFGISEIANSATVHKMYQCQSCGNIVKK